MEEEEEEIAGFDEEPVMAQEKEPRESDPVPNKPKSHCGIILLLILIILAGVGAFFYFSPQGRNLNPFIKKNNSSQQNKTTSQQAGANNQNTPPKYTIDDAKKFVSTQNNFTFYYPKTWFSENEITPGTQQEFYGVDSYFYFYPDKLSTNQEPDRTYLSISASQNLADINSDGSLANYVQKRIVEGQSNITMQGVSFENSDAFQVIEDDSSATGPGYFDEYIFMKPQLNYYRQKNTIFIITAHTKDKATLDQFNDEFSFMFDNLMLDPIAYNDQYVPPVLSAKDQQRKNDVEHVADILDQYYSDRGEYPLYLTFDGLMTKLQQDGYLDHNIEDPDWPNKGYHYGSVCAAGAAFKSGNCFYRVDAEFDDQTQTILKNDGGADATRYEVGSSLGENKDKVQYME